MADSPEEKAFKPNGSFIVRDDGAVVITLDPPGKNSAGDQTDAMLLLYPGGSFGGVPYAKFIERPGGSLYMDPRRRRATILGEGQQLRGPG